MSADASYTTPAPTLSQFAQSWSRDAPADLLVKITPSTRLVACPDGKYIHPYSGPAQGMSLVLCGRVHISRTTDGGGGLVYSMLRADEWLGEIAFVDGGDRTHSTRVQGPTALILLGGAASTRVVSAYPAGIWALIQQLCQHIRPIFDEFGHTSETPTDMRLAQHLPQLAHVGNDRIAATNNEELGRMLARSRQTISRYLRA